MQNKKLHNLIASIYYSVNNSNIKHYIIKHNNKCKHIKHNVNSLSNIYANLYKHYNCSKQQLNLLQFVYSYNNLKLTTKYYNIAQRNAINKALQTM